MKEGSRRIDEGRIGGWRLYELGKGRRIDEGKIGGGPVACL